MAEPEKKDDENGVSIEGKLRLRGGRGLLKSISDRVNWTFIAVVLIGGPSLASSVVNMWTGAEAKQAIEVTQEKIDKAKQTATEVKHIAVQAADVGQKAATAAQQASHELHNGLAKRMAKELDAVQAPRFEAMQKQINELRQEQSDLRRFLLGEGGAGAKSPDTTTASRDGG